MKKIQISDHFKASTILLFALPSIGMQLVDNTYQVADGYFISNYVGASAFAAENLIFPPLMIVAGIGLMFGTGAAALISHTLGENDPEKANCQLSLTVGTLAGVSVLASALLFILLPWIMQIVGVPENLVPMCLEYGQILAVCMPFLILNGAFHPLLITANRPGLGLAVSFLNAAINILLDWILVGELGMKLTGAALATGVSWVCSATVPLVYFFNRRHPMHFGPFCWNAKELGQTCYNGSSEMMGVISFAFITVLINSRLLRLAGEAGVDAYAVCSYAGGLFSTVFFGIGMSITPAVGYHHGENNPAEVRAILKNGTGLMAGLGLGIAAACFAAARPTAVLFVGYEQELADLSVEALRITSIAFLLGGLTSFYSSFFTGMGDAGRSLAISVVKTVVLPLIGVFLLPLIFGRQGIWLMSLLSETGTFALACVFLRIYQKKNIL